MYKFKVSLYLGVGYWMETVEVEAYHDAHALAQAVASGIGCVINEFEAGFEDWFYDESWYYLDLSEYDKPNCLVLLDNAIIEIIE